MEGTKMDRSKNNRRRRQSREYWQQIVKQQEDSGETVSDFCRNHHVGIKSFYRWRCRLRGPVKSDSLVEQKNLFVEVNGQARPPVGSSITIGHGDFTIEVASGFNDETLRRVLCTLRSAVPISDGTGGQ